MILSFFFCNQILLILFFIREKRNYNIIEDHLYYVIVYATYQTSTHRDSCLSTPTLTSVKLATCFLSLFINTNCFVLDTIGNTKKKKEEEKERWALSLTHMCTYMMDGKEWTKGNWRKKRERERERQSTDDREKCRPYHTYIHTNSDKELNWVSHFRGLCI
jgi:hypothetical protein